MAIGAIQTSVLQTDAHPVLIHTGRFTLSLMCLCRIGQRSTRHKLRISLSAKEPSPVKKLQQEVKDQEEDTSPKHRKQPVCPAQRPVTTDRGESHRLQFAISACITDADAVGTCQRQGIGQTKRLIPTRQPQPQADSRSISRFFPHYLLPTMVQTVCRHRTFHHQISMVNADTPIPTNVVTIFLTRNLIIQASLRRTDTTFHRIGKFIQPAGCSIHIHRYRYIAGIPNRQFPAQGLRQGLTYQGFIVPPLAAGTHLCKKQCTRGTSQQANIKRKSSVFHLYSRYSHCKNKKKTDFNHFFIHTSNLHGRIRRKTSPIRTSRSDLFPPLSPSEGMFFPLKGKGFTFERERSSPLKGKGFPYFEKAIESFSPFWKGA